MQVSIVDIMLPAFAECLVLVGIHSYLGIHVIKRKVIFVDLSLAQIAALGTTVAFLFGLSPQSEGAYWFSLGFTMLGAAIFSLSRFKNEKIPQEAVIGLVYALAAAIAILVVDKAPHGAEHIKEIMTGSILWVQWPTIIKAAIVYALVGGFHFLFRDRFILISNNPEAAYARGINVRFWDFLFYLSFGIVITHSVNTAGVLLVFVFLVVPAIATMMITDKLWLQLVIGWTMGTLVSVIGLALSYYLDLPSGPTVVTTYGLVLLVLSLVLYIVRAENRMIAVRNVALGIVTTILLAFIFYEGGHFFNHHDHTAAAVTTPQQTVNQHIDLDQMTDTAFAQFVQQLKTKKQLMDALTQVSDDFRRWEIIQRLIQVAPAEGYHEALHLLEATQIPLLRSEIYDTFKQAAGRDFGYDPFAEASENSRSLRALKQWWHTTFQRGNGSGE